MAVVEDSWSSGIAADAMDVVDENSAANDGYGVDVPLWRWWRW